MATGDIATQTLNVGNALASVRIDTMIVNLAKGIAQGQFKLDSEGVEITKLMGVPGTVSIGNENLSMLEAGFIPTFYQFVDTILEMKMEIKVRSETSSETKVSTETSASVSAKAKAGWGWGSAEVNATAAYSRSVDATHAQKYSQDLSAQSLMRTKLVPVPAPEMLVERISMLLEKAKEGSEENVSKDDAIANYMKEIIPATA